MQLKVRQAERDDVYRDIARVPQADRQGIPEGVICRVSVAGKSRDLAIRGLAGRREEIALDEYSREQLGVELGQSYDFQLRRVWLPGQVRWALRAADPGVRVATMFAIIGTVLGIVGLLLPLAQCALQGQPTDTRAEVVVQEAN